MNIDATTASDSGLRLILTKSGTPRGCSDNARLVLQMDPEWSDVFGYDCFADCVTLLRDSPAHRTWRERTYPRPLADHDITLIKAWLEQKRAIHVPLHTVHSVVDVVARRKDIHPVRDYLLKLVWDGSERLPTWLSDHFNAQGDERYIQSVSTMVLISGVARVMIPGAKVDHVLVLQGAQGAGKSRGLRAMLPNEAWFSDEIGRDLSKDSAERLPGKLIVEMSELDVLGRAEATRVKSFLSRQVDRYRPAYGRIARDFPRQCIFVGTTNSDEYLRDATGNRRFWPVSVGKVDVAGLAAVRDQLWAEAVVRYQRGEAWHLPPEIEALAREEQESRRQLDPWTETLAPYLEQQTITSVGNCFARLEIDLQRQTQADSNRIARILREYGFKRTQRRINGIREWIYSRASPLSPLPTTTTPSKEDDD